MPHYTLFLRLSNQGDWDSIPLGARESISLDEIAGTCLTWMHDQLDDPDAGELVEYEVRDQDGDIFDSGEV